MAYETAAQNTPFETTPAAQAQQDFVPLLIGADMNAYSVARALHEQYGVVSHALGRFAAGDTKYSRIVQVALEPNLEDLDVLLARISWRCATSCPKTAARST